MWWTRPAAGTVVTLELSNPRFRGQIGSMAEPVHHPRHARAFIVSTQTPRPGTRVLWGGVETAGVDPGLATVTISLQTTAAG